MEAQLCSFMYSYSYHLHMQKPHWFFWLYFHLGVTISKVLQMVEFVGIKVISSPTYYRRVYMFIQPTGLMFFETHQIELIDTFIQTNSSGLIVPGDGRCDSPGHCAKCGSYTFMEQRCNKVLHFELVQVNAFYVFMCLLAIFHNTWSCFNLLWFVYNFQILQSFNNMLVNSGFWNMY